MPYRIAGIDVHKRMLAVVVTDVSVEGAYACERRRVGTSPRDLRELAAWLVLRAVEEVVMESTAQYWRPVWDTLERDWTPRRRTPAGAGSMRGAYCRRWRTEKPVPPRRRPWRIAGCAPRPTSWAMRSARARISTPSTGGSCTWRSTNYAYSKRRSVTSTKKWHGCSVSIRRPWRGWPQCRGWGWIRRSRSSPKSGPPPRRFPRPSNWRPG